MKLALKTFQNILGKLRDVEQELEAIGENMKQLEISAEKAQEREEKLKDKKLAEDSLQQEKSRGITIDLGFAYLNDRITIVDVPGHQKFIRNMVAGASTMHLGLLVIAADDGIMPQTLEHLHILDSLSILNI